MTGAKVPAVDFRGAQVWLTQPPEPDPTGLTDFTDLQMRPLDESEVSRLNAMLERIDQRRVRGQVRDAIAAILDTAESQKWSGSEEYQRWQALLGAATAPQSDTFRQRLTDYLAQFMCKARYSNGSVATGVARRAQSPNFGGDLVAIYDRLREDDCPGGKALLPKVHKSISTAADIARSN